MERLKKFGLTTLHEKRLRGDLIKTFKIINEISNYGRHFLIISWTGNLLSKPISNTKSTNQLDFEFFFFVFIFLLRESWFLDKLLHQVKNGNSVKTLKLNWRISEKMVRK